jgi:O-antigen ligase
VTRLLAWLVPLTLAWGVLAFGAVYPWAYVPLLVAAAGIGILGITAGLRDRAGLKPCATSDTAVRWPVAASLPAVALAVALQLVPLSSGTLAAVSPATDSFLRRHNLPYATATTTPNSATSDWASHPLSVRPDSTRRALGFLAALAVCLVGLAAYLSTAEGSPALRRAQGTPSKSRGEGLRYTGEGSPCNVTTTLAEAITILGVVVALAGIIQKATATTGRIYGLWTPQLGGNPFGPFVNRNHFAGWMMMALALAIGLCCGWIARGMRGVKPHWRNRILWFSSPDASRLILTAFAALVMGIALVLSFSRSGIACFAIAIVIATWFAARRQTTRSKRAVAGAYLVFVIVVAVGWVGVDQIAKRFAAAQWDDVGGRLGAWADAWRIFRDFPAAGVGLNAFGEAMLDYQTDYADLYHFASAHNDYAQLLAEGGLLVGLPVLLTLIVFIREVRRRFREAQDDTMSYWLRIGAATGLVAIALQEVVEFSLQMPGNALLFVVLGAIAIRRAPPRRVEGAPS